jgi:uncharacterized cupredoxin-like copper-binding protein
MFLQPTFWMHCMFKIKNVLATLALGGLCASAWSTPAAAPMASMPGMGSMPGMASMSQGQAMPQPAVPGNPVSVGGPGTASAVSRTIRILADDRMRFSPDVVHVKPGETVRIVVVNQGHLRHELTIGTQSELEEHAKMMAAMPDMPNGKEPNMVAVAPQGQGELIWRFGQPGTVPFACTMPGHMQQGMIGRFIVD